MLADSRQSETAIASKMEKGEKESFDVIKSEKKKIDSNCNIYEQNIIRLTEKKS
jgi:hypothetical protein